MSTTVFISSTVDDLIDLRSELEDSLRGLGVTPILSDRLTADFQVQPDRNAIENCLANVRRSDQFIVVLSQRYGPSLSREGYPDISATHLEYREARKHKKPILMYVRDRLEADYRSWLKNRKRHKSDWVAEKDRRLFEFLREHERATKVRSKSNWVWVFGNSVELKERLRADMKARASRAILSKLMEQGHLPYLIASTMNWSIDRKTREISISMRVANAGVRAAIDVLISLNWDWEMSYQTAVAGERHLAMLLPAQEYSFDTAICLPRAEMKRGFTRLWVNCMYSTLDGHLLEDKTFFEFSYQGNEKFEPPLWEYQGKTYGTVRGVDQTTWDEEPPLIILDDDEEGQAGSP